MLSAFTADYARQQFIFTISNLDKEVVTILILHLKQLWLRNIYIPKIT